MQKEIEKLKAENERLKAGMTLQEVAAIAGDFK